MKKLLTLVISIICLCVLAGCGGSSNGKDTKVSPGKEIVQLHDKYFGYKGAFTKAETQYYQANRATSKGSGQDELLEKINQKFVNDMMAIQKQINEEKVLPENTNYKETLASLLKNKIAAQKDFFAFSSFLRKHKADLRAGAGINGPKELQDEYANLRKKAFFGTNGKAYADGKKSERAMYFKAVTGKELVKITLPIGGNKSRVADAIDLDGIKILPEDVSMINNSNCAQVGVSLEVAKNTTIDINTFKMLCADDKEYHFTKLCTVEPNGKRNSPTDKLQLEPGKVYKVMFSGDVSKEIKHYRDLYLATAGEPFKTMIVFPQR